MYFHAHGAAWRAQAFGRTKWYLLPPNAYFGPVYGNMVEFLERGERLPVPPLEVVQEEGEVLFVPEKWLHATLNLQFTLALSVPVGNYSPVKRRKRKKKREKKRRRRRRRSRKKKKKNV